MNSHNFLYFGYTRKEECLGRIEGIYIQIFLPKQVITELNSI